MATAAAPTTSAPAATIPVTPAPEEKKLSLVEKPVEYVPLGENEPITLTMALIKKWLVTPTKSGEFPTDSDILKFMMLCKARELNPWVGDAYLVGYDSRENGPTFNLITSVQALFKRADLHPKFDGLESGVVVLNEKTGIISEREGDFFLADEKLVGGWCKVYRSDRTRPVVEKLNFDTYDKGRSVWKTDPEGMISKCAEAGALRKAFPNQLAGLYLQEEFDGQRTIDTQAQTVDAKTESETNLDALAAKVSSRRALGHTEQSPNFSEQATAAKAAAQQAAQARETPKETNQQPVASKAADPVVEPAASEMREPKLQRDDEPDIVADFRSQIDAAESEEEIKAMLLTIRRSKTLDDEQRRFLTRVANDKASDLSEG